MPTTTTTGKTNTGHKDPRGRTIWRGPRGGHFVMNGERKISVDEPAGPSRSGPSRSGPSRAGPSRSGPSRAGPSKTLPWTVLKAAHKFKHGTFEDPITYARVAKKNGIALGQHGHVYSKASMRRWIAGKPPHQQTLPLTREVVTNAERRAIMNHAGHVASTSSGTGSSTHARAGHGHGGSNSNSNATSGRRLNRPSASENVDVHLAIFTRADVNARGHPIRHPEVRDIDLPAMTALSQIFRRLPAIDRVEIIRPGHPNETVQSTTLENVGHFAYSRGGGWEAYVRVFYR